MLMPSSRASAIGGTFAARSMSAVLRPERPWMPRRARRTLSWAVDTLFLAVPVASKGRLLQYVGRIVRPYDGKATAEVHDYHDELTGVLASSLAKRAPGYTSLGFPDPRKLPYTPSADTARPAQPGGLPS
jgi:hypothetical protein